MYTFKAAVFYFPYIPPVFFWLSATSSDPPPSLFCYPFVSKPPESGLSKTSTMYFASDILIRSLITSLFQCLLTTTYIYSWWRGCCGSPTNLVCRFLWEETHTDRGRARHLHRTMMWLYHSTMTPTCTCDYKNKSLKLKSVSLSCWTIFLLLLSIWSALLCSQWPSYAPYAHPSSAPLFTSLSMCFCFAEQHWHSQACCSICLPQRSSSMMHRLHRRMICSAVCCG